LFDSAFDAAWFASFKVDEVADFGVFKEGGVVVNGRFRSPVLIANKQQERRDFGFALTQIQLPRQAVLILDPAKLRAEWVSL
jgi:hypothetical protein